MRTLFLHNNLYFYYDYILKVLQTCIASSHWNSFGNNSLKKLGLLQRVVSNQFSL
ncbi:hypothetical protein MKW98_028711, partial [Papaver atlanticum]